MTSEVILKLEQRLFNDNEYTHPRDVPDDFIESVKNLPNEEAMELAARLFMRTEWRYYLPSAIIFKIHPTARTKITAEYLEPLGVTTSPVTETAVAANYERLLARPGSGSSFWSVTSSWAGIWGDLGLLGLIVIGALWLVVWRHICADDLSKFLLLTVVILSFIYPWMEEPGYMIFVSAVIGLRFQERRIQGQNAVDARRPLPGYVAQRESE